MEYRSRIEEPSWALQQGVGLLIFTLTLLLLVALVNLLPVVALKATIVLVGVRFAYQLANRFVEWATET